MVKKVLSAVIASLIVSIAAGPVSSMSERQPLRTGDGPAQRGIDISIKDLNGKDFRLSEAKGRVVFVNFFATWCPPCREEMPSMQSLYEKMKGQKFDMIAISIDRSSSSSVQKFIKDGGYTFRVAHDKENVLAEKYGIFSIPATYIIDKNGEVAAKISGAREWDSPQVLSDIRKMMK